MGYAVLAVFTLIMFSVTVALLYVLREMRHVKRGIAGLTNVSTRTNLYAQRAIAARAKQAGVQDDTLTAPPLCKEADEVTPAAASQEGTAAPRA